MLGGFANDPAAGVTSRQNLALAYGLAGDTSAAENIGRIDLSPDPFSDLLNGGLIPRLHGFHNIEANQFVNDRDGQQTVRCNRRMHVV